MHLVWTVYDGQIGRKAHIPSNFLQPPMGVEFLTFQSFYCLLFLLKLVFPLVICIISNFFCCCVVFPGHLTTPSVPYVRWQVSLMWAACLYGGKSLCRGALLPQGVFPLLNLRLYTAPGRTCLWLKTRFVPWSTWLKTFRIQLTTSYWGWLWSYRKTVLQTSLRSAQQWDKPTQEFVAARREYFPCFKDASTCNQCLLWSISLPSPSCGLS